jgi:hypothetical protein
MVSIMGGSQALCEILSGREKVMDFLIGTAYGDDLCW